MTLARLLPFHIHGALETVVAPLLMVAPFLFDFEPPAAIASIVIGVLIMAVALASHVGDSIPVSTHAAFDVCFAVALALSSVACAFAGDAAAAAVLGPAALVLLLLMSLTRYSPSHA